MEMITNVVNKVVGEVRFPALGADDDVKKAQDIVGEDATVFAALRTPAEFYKMSSADYCRLACMPCFCIAAITASKTLENSLYIVSDNEVKVHVDPFKPPLGIGSPNRELPKMDFKDVTEVKIVREGGSCIDPREKTGIEFEKSGVKFFIKDPEQLQDIIAKAKKFAGGASNAVAKVQSLQEGQRPTQDQGQSS